MDYMLHVAARLEHEQRQKELFARHQYDFQAAANEPGWLAERAGQLLSALGDGFVALGERMKQRQEEPASVPCFECE